jgi:ribonuclease HII
MLRFERPLWVRGLTRIAGVDEAGRGPLAGPVVAAAVIFRRGTRIRGVNDSKQLTPEQRERLYPRIMEAAQSVGVGIVDAATIDRINILQATLQAMIAAVGQLAAPPEHVIVDGNRAFPCIVPVTPIVRGDGRSLSIAAASIIAKVTRDRFMCACHIDFPMYGFASHKGYGTLAHRQAIVRHGLSPLHRRSFIHFVTHELDA